MTTMNDTPPPAASDLTWLLDGFKRRVSGVETVLIASVDGRATHTMTGLHVDDADRLAAITSSAYGLMRRADIEVGGPGLVRQQVAQLDTHTFFVTAAGENSLLAVVTGPTADAGQVGHEMALLAAQAATYLATQSRTPDPAV